MSPSVALCQALCLEVTRLMCAHAQEYSCACVCVCATALSVTHTILSWIRRKAKSKPSGLMWGAQIVDVFHFLFICLEIIIKGKKEKLSSKCKASPV